MKAGQTFCCLYVVTLYCVLTVVSASDDQDLMDFDFADLKEVDWNYNDGDATVSTKAVKSAVAMDEMDKKLQTNKVTFDDDFDEDDNQVNPFNWRERVLRTALSKALTNTQLRQRFIEVMPILRVLSSQQRLALSALISAQVNARQGQQLKLEQVRMMFGNDKKLLLPIVYDIANLVRNSARNYLHFIGDDLVPAAEYQQMQTPAAKRNIELTSAEEADDADDIGVVPISAKASEDAFASLEDFFAEMPSDVLDPKRINEELQAPIGMVKEQSTSTMKPTTTITMTTTVIPIANRRRRRRSTAVETTEFVHKLLRSMPLSVNEEDLLRGAAGRTMRLNTTAFMLPQENQSNKEAAMQRSQSSTSTTTTQAAVTIVTPSSNSLPDFESDGADSHAAYHDVEDLAFASLNGSDINLSSSSSDSGPLSSAAEIKTADGEPLPNPEELIAGPRYRFAGNKVHLMRPKMAIKRKRVQVRPHPKSPLSLPSKHAPVVVAPRKCERFTASMCIHADDYPLDAIMGSIRRHKNAMTALLAEYHDNIGDIEFKDEFEDYPFHKKRREDVENGGSSGMCQSIVRYARPQKARSANGEWKYIVNTGQHTQTLRLEKCSNPQESCSYLAQSYRSHCSQVYNYHRLLSWDKMRGLHVDIFKVPTCCSCQIDGYRQQFPPLNSIKAKDYTPAISADLYSTISDDDLDYNDHEEDDDTLNYPNQYGHSYHPQPHKREKLHGYDADELLLSSNKVRTKTHMPKPTVGSYLSPPDGGGLDYDSHKNFAYKGSRISSPSTPDPAANNLLQHLARRRPYKSLQNEDRVDLEISPSEQHTDKEVKYYGRNSAAQTPLVRPKQQQRKRIYTVPIHTASPSTGTNNSGAGGTVIFPGSSSSSVAKSDNAAAAARPTYYTSSSISNGHQNILAVAASHLPPSTTTSAAAATTKSSAASTPPTESTYYTSAIPPSYHVNSIYSTKYGGSSGSISPKRINYSYHPIIDFFETNKRAAAVSNIDADDDDDDDIALAASSSPSSSSVSPTINSDLLYHQKIPKSTPKGVSLPPSTVYQSRERRIGYGAGAGADDNAWRPLVMES